MDKSTGVNEFLTKEPKELPVFLLLDASGSMDGNDRIGVLNRSVNAMIKSFKDLATTAARISVAVISFGVEGAKVVQSLTPASDIKSINLTADGGTPLGAAINKAKEMIENVEIVKHKSYRPVVVLVSDGMPNDNWQEPMKRFCTEGRSAKCNRMAMGIGAEEGTSEYRMLQSFISDGEVVHTADDAMEIVKFFNFVTMSVSVRSQSQNPNKTPDIASSDTFSRVDLDLWLKR